MIKCHIYNFVCLDLAGEFLKVSKSFKLHTLKESYGILKCVPSRISNENYLPEIKSIS